MLFNKTTLFFALVFFSFFSVKSQETAWNHQTVVDVSFQNPKEAQQLLKDILSRANAALPDSTEALAYSKLGITYSMTAQNDSANYFFNKGVKKAERNKLLKAKILSNKGINLRMMAWYPDAIDALNSSMLLYEDLQNDEGKAIVHGELASVYSYLKLNDSVISHLQTGLNLLADEPNNPSVTVLKQKLANAYLNKGDYAFARQQYEDLLPKLASSKNHNYYYTLLSYAECLQIDGQLDEAAKVLKEASNGLESLGDSAHHYLAKGKLAKIAYEQDSIELAKDLYRTAYQGLLDLRSPRLMEIAGAYMEFLNETQQYAATTQLLEQLREAEAYPNLAMNAQTEMHLLTQAIRANAALQNYGNAFHLSERRNAISDSLKRAINTIEIAKIEEAFENNIHLSRNENLREQNHLLEQYNTIKTLIIILGILFFIMVLGVIVYARKKDRQELEIQKEAFENAERARLHLAEKEHLERELTEQLRVALQDKERELTAVSLEMANLQKNIEQVIENSTGSKKPSNGDIAGSLQRILKNANYWEFFKKKFVEVHPNFFSNIKKAFPELTDTEVDFCSLVKVRMENKEIASLLGITHASVISKKYRIRKKMGLQDQDNSLEEFIENL